MAPWNILAITFTNKAAKEMRQRVSALVGERGGEVWVSTFHAMCARILRRDIEKLGYTRSFTIYDDDDQSSVLKELFKQFGIDDKSLTLREVKAKISDAKDHLLSPDEWFQASAKDFRSQQIHDLYDAYERRLRHGNAWILTICWFGRWSCSPTIRPCWRVTASAFAMCTWTNTRIPTLPSIRW